MLEYLTRPRFRVIYYFVLKFSVPFFDHGVTSGFLFFKSTVFVGFCFFGKAVLSSYSVCT